MNADTMVKNMTGVTEYKHNHYVPEWYQKRFMVPDQKAYCYLDLKPDVITNNGHRYTLRDLHFWGPRRCFAEDDLYTTRWDGSENTDIEQFFFGAIDRAGKSAVEFFDSFQHSRADDTAFLSLVRYMSVQKLRTPKGLGWLGQISYSSNRNLDLIFLQDLQDMFCAIWTECVWQVADATQSSVKFIISDHPVTVYNRACFPQSAFCKGFNDPDIRFVASQTYFPLSLDKVLILTNLSWVRNPYQKETALRPNSNYFREAIFKYNDVQIFRSLSETEVLQINSITKRRAFRYIAGAEKNWLYPERYLRSDHWRNLGQGYLLMPEPRGVYMGGEVYISYKDGSSAAFGEYGHRPWQDGYKDEQRALVEDKSLERFKAEFAQMQGPAWRGSSHSFGRLGPHFDCDDTHQDYLMKAKAYRTADRKRRR